MRSSWPLYAGDISPDCGDVAAPIPILALPGEAELLRAALPPALAADSMAALLRCLPAAAVVLSETALHPGDAAALQAWPDIPIVLLTGQDAPPPALAPRAAEGTLVLLPLLPASLSSLASVLRALLRAQNRQSDEAQVAQARKLAAIARFAGCIAHDVNNLLTGVMGSLELIQRRTQEARTAQLAAQGLTAAGRGGRMMRPLLRIAQVQPLELVPVAISDQLAAMREQLQEALGAGVVLRLELDPSLPPARTDPGELELAMLQIATNAREAMPAGGTLHVATFLRHSRRPGAERLVVIRVADTGHGMTAATLEQVFEPYFTTRGGDGHRGLGMSQVHGLVSQSGGRAILHSALGAGTIVELELPAAGAPSGDYAAR